MKDDGLPKIICSFTEKNLKNMSRIFCHLAYWELENTVHLLIENANCGEYRLESLIILSGVIHGAICPKSSVVQSLLQYFLDKNAEIDLYALDDLAPKEQKQSVMTVIFFLTILISGLFLKFFPGFFCHRRHWTFGESYWQ